MRWWPEDAKARRNAMVRVGVLLALVAFGAYALRHRFGFARHGLTPAIAAEVPADTPVPVGTALAGTLRPEWKAIRVGARSRDALWLVPAGSEKRPLVMVLHGDGGDARGFHHDFSYEEASGDWAVLVYPDGLGHGWDTDSPDDNKDVAFLDALVDEAVATRNVDPARIFLTGYSSGGFVAQLYACQRSSRVRGIATHEAGAPYNQREKWPNGSPKCPGQAPVATLVTHGRDDYTVTFQSGEYSAFYWAAVNGCDTAHAHRGGYAQCYAYDGCEKPTAFCDIPNLGHWVWSDGAVASVAFFQKL